MSSFPRTEIEGVSVSRLMIGTNWFLGFSHTTRAKDDDIRNTMNSSRIADIVETFMNRGVDTLYGIRPDEKLVNGVKEAEQRTGKKCITVVTPTLPHGQSEDDLSEAARILDESAALGATFCFPHQCTTDAFVDRRTRSLKGMEVYCAMIRERGMIPGLSTHMPESIPFADESGLDVGTYIQIYNAAGFLMQLEVDWVQRIIWKAKKPVITIKPLASGKLPPLVGLTFSWNSIRKQDCICIGTFSADEAAEVVELSLAALEHRMPERDLQKTRSKKSL